MQLMLETALKEVHSKAAQREIGNAITAIRCMAEIINDTDRKDTSLRFRKRYNYRSEKRTQQASSGYKFIYLNAKNYYVRFYRDGKMKTILSTKDLTEAIRVRDEFLAKEKADEETNTTKTDKGLA